MEKFLVVEDNKDMRKRICKFLIREKYETIEAENGRIGLEMATKFKPDLILSDVMMPEMDGFTFLEKIREESSTKLIPFIILTVKDKEEEVLEGLRLGAQDYVTKPFNFDILHERIKRQLDLLNYHRRLETEKQEHLVAIAMKKKHLELKNRLIKRITHDINGPLTAVKGNAELILAKLNSLRLEEEKERLLKEPTEKIVKASDLISDKLKDLLKDIQNGHERKVLDLETLADKVIEYNRDYAKLKHQEIEFQGQENLFVKGYKEYLMSAMDNLIKNAIKFSPEKTPIRISLEKETDYVYFKIRDGGAGLTEEQKEKYRTSPTNADNKPVGEEYSHGLGAVIVATVIEDHNGQLLIDSEPGNGTTFIMKLPRADRLAAIPKPDSISAMDIGAETKSIPDYLPVYIYLDTDDEEIIENTKKGVFDLVSYIGYQLDCEFPPQRSSFFQKLICNSKKVISHPEFKKKMEQVEYAIKQKTIAKEQSIIDKNLSEAASCLLQANENVPNIAINLGSLLIVKVTINKIPKVIVRNLNTDEMMRLDKNPNLLKSPNDILDGLLLDN